MTQHEMCIGIDVAKAQLDWAARPSGERQQAPNTEAGISGLVEQWRAAPPTAIVVEATGRLEVPLVSALAAAGLPVSVVNPAPGARLRQSHGALGQDRCVGRRRAGAVCRSRAADAAADCR
jgi:transposase